MGLLTIIGGPVLVQWYKKGRTGHETTWTLRRQGGQISGLHQRSSWNIPVVAYIIPDCTCWNDDGRDPQYQRGCWTWAGVGIEDWLGYLRDLRMVESHSGLDINLKTDPSCT